MITENDDHEISATPEEAQDLLDAALHDLHELAEEHADDAKHVDELIEMQSSLEAVRIELQFAQETWDDVGRERLSMERLADLRIVAESIWSDVDPEMHFPDVPSTESFELEGREHLTLSLEVIASSLAKFERWITQFVSNLDLSIANFFAGTARVSRRALDVLAHSDRLLDGATEPTIRQLSFTGAAARSLQAGTRTLTLNESVSKTLEIGNYTVGTWLPAQLKYAHDMANAFGQSDLTHLTDGLGLTKHGFMKRALPFAEVHPFVPSFCKHESDHRYFFKLFRDVYRSEMSSDPLPGNRIVKVTHPVGSLKKYADREDFRGFSENFIPWLTVQIGVTKAKGVSGSSAVVTIPSATELKHDNEELRKLVKELRDMTVKSDEIKNAMNSMLDAYESHVYKHLSGVVNTIKNLTINLIPTFAAANHVYGMVATGSASSLYSMVVDMGKYLSGQCHGLATVSLKCAKTFKSPEKA